MNLICYQYPQLTTRSSRDGFASLRDEMDHLFDFTWPARDSGLFSGWSPALDVHDEKDNLIVHVELPGMKTDEIGISLHDGVLTVSGERKTERAQKAPRHSRDKCLSGQGQHGTPYPQRVARRRMGIDRKRVEE